MPRTRSDSTDSSANSVIQVSSDVGQTWSDYATINMRQLTCSAKTMQDVITPGFRIRQARGEIMMSPCKSWVSEVSRRANYGYSVVKRASSDDSVIIAFAARCTGNYTTEHRHPWVPMASLDAGTWATIRGAFGLTDLKMATMGQKALARAVEKASSPDAMGLVSLAELDKTVDLFRECAKSVLAGCSLLESLGPKRLRELNVALRRIGKLSKKRKIKLFLQSLDSGLANLCRKWLGFRYGVMATVYDVESWIEASQSDSRRIRVVATENDDEDVTPDWTIVPNWQGDTYPGTGLFRSRATYRRKSVVRAGVIIGAEAQGLGDKLGLNRIASSDWELIPFSFVVDWLADVGTRLSAHEGSLLVRSLGSWISHEHYLIYTHTHRWEPTNSSQSTTYCTASGADEGILVDSTVYRERISNPTLSFIPQLDVNLNWKRIIDSVALLKVGSSRLSNVLLKKL